MKILVINGPNLNLLGTREPDIYGSLTYNDLINELNDFANKKNIKLEFFQSNHEGEIVDRLHKTLEDGINNIIINPGALSHYSLSVSDALRSINKNVIEVHISNIFARENYRSTSVTAASSIGVISGLGFTGYKLAIDYFLGSNNI